MRQKAPLSDDERQIRRAIGNPFTIVSGAALYDPRVQNGRNAHERHEADGSEIDDLHTEHEKEQDGATGIILRALSASAANDAKADWSLPPIDQPIILIRDRVTGEHLYNDKGGVFCGRISDTTSFAKQADVASGDVVAVSKDKSAASSFTKVAAGQNLDPFADLHNASIADGFLPRTAKIKLPDDQPTSFTGLPKDAFMAFGDFGVQPVALKGTIAQNKTGFLDLGFTAKNDEHFQLAM